jgi:hypothetical protein
MERLVSIVDQIEEAKAFIRRGDISHLRLALLLLDNASEILMYRAVTEELTWHDYRSRIFSRAKDVMSNDELKAFKMKMGYEPMSSRDRKILLQKYDAKIDFLIALKKKPRLPSPIGQVLKATHRYRNEAYHRDRIRKESIQPVVIVLFDIVTDLMLIFTPGSISYSSSDHWTGFCKRYGFEHQYQVFPDGLPVIVESLKEDMHPDISGVASALADHIESRLVEMEDALSFLSKDSGAGFSPEEELRRVQFWAQYDYVPQQKDEAQFKDYNAPISLQTFTRWRAQGNQLRHESDKLELFLHFSQTEAEIEPIEERIHQAAGLLDEAIQFAIDQARGK